MLNVGKLEIGNIVKIHVDDTSKGLEAGDTLVVANVGFSPWDGMSYADCKTDDGHVVEIMKDYRNYSLVC